MDIKFIQKTYREAQEPIEKKGGRAIYMPNAPRIILCGGKTFEEGKYHVYKLQLGETEDFAIVSTKTPYSRAVGLAYESKRNILRMYGKRAYMKLLCAFNTKEEASDFAKVLRDLYEKTCNEHFKRLSW